MKQKERSIKTAAQLIEQGLATPDQRADLERLMASYAVAITPAVASLVDPQAGTSDPIFAQFVPTMAELNRHPAELDDPIGDEPHSPAPGIVHRYADRCLLKVVSICPVYCRFCFRREMVGPARGNQLAGDELDEAIAYISQHPEIWEVIVTGGDPLILSPRRVADITERLASVPHVRVLRWHTRVPVVDPERIDDAMVSALRVPDKAVYVALHANNPRELTSAARSACARLIDAGIPMVSQTVLLQGVNDDADILEALMRAFVEIRVKPYYLHHPDLAPGTSHFRVPIARGQAIIAELRRRLSGLAMPEYVLDIPGGYGKIPIGPGYLHVSASGEGYEATDRNGVRHSYRDCCAIPSEG